MLDFTLVLAEGMEAALDGVPIQSCPYKVGSLGHDRWIEGWRIANDIEEDHLGSELKGPEAP